MSRKCISSRCRSAFLRVFVLKRCSLFFEKSALWWPTKVSYYDYLIKHKQTVFTGPNRWPVQFLVVCESIPKVLYPLSTWLLCSSCCCMIYRESSHGNRSIIVQRLSIYIWRVVVTETNLCILIWVVIMVIR